MNKINKKGDLEYTFITIAILIFVLVILLVANNRGVLKPIKKWTDCPEEYCAEQCSGTEREQGGKTCKNDDLKCCMTPEELIGLKKPGEGSSLNTSNAILPNNTCAEQSCVKNATDCTGGKTVVTDKKCKQEGFVCCLTPEEIQKTSNINPGKVIIYLGDLETSSLAGTSRELKVGMEYRFKISNSGIENKCNIKLLDSETSTEVKETWIAGTGDYDCKTSAHELILTPGLQQINKRYTLQVILYNESGAKVDVALVNLAVIPNTYN